MFLFHFLIICQIYLIYIFTIKNYIYVLLYNRNRDSIKNVFLLSFLVKNVLISEIIGFLSKYIYIFKYILFGFCFWKIAAKPVGYLLFRMESNYNNYFGN